MSNPISPAKESGMEKAQEDATCPPPAAGLSRRKTRRTPINDADDSVPVATSASRSETQNAAKQNPRRCRRVRRNRKSVVAFPNKPIEKIRPKTTLTRYLKFAKNLNIDFRNKCYSRSCLWAKIQAMLELDDRAVKKFTTLRNVRVTVVGSDYSDRNLKWKALDALEDEMVRIQCRLEKYNKDLVRERQELREVTRKAVCCRYCLERNKKHF